jgi:hypothetical protein
MLPVVDDVDVVPILSLTVGQRLPAVVLHLYVLYFGVDGDA